MLTKAMASSPASCLKAQTNLKMVSKLAILREFLDFLRVRQKWWIMPIIIVLLLLGGLLIFANGSALAPFIYTLF